MSSSLPDLAAEWLESDGQGGFASGAVGGFRTRRYHALLLTPQRPPAERVVLVNGFEAWAETASGSFPLSTQHYAPDVEFPRGVDHLVAFTTEPWPCWTFRLPGGETVVQECVVDPVDGSVVLAWRIDGVASFARLSVRPLLSGRDYHALMRENAAFGFDARAAAGNATWRPYAGLPAMAALSNGLYVHEPIWFRNFFYGAEAARGLDCIEDLASPGSFHFDLAASEAVMVLRVGDGIAVDAIALASRVRELEGARRASMSLEGAPTRTSFSALQAAPVRWTGPSPGASRPLDGMRPGSAPEGGAGLPWGGPARGLDRAAETYIVRRGNGHTAIAGFPWFTDWGRDTFIAMRGLVLARGQLDLAASILDGWAGTVSEGMLPNRFPDHGETPEFNAVDASLWFVIVAHEFLRLHAAPPAVRDRLTSAVDAILDGYTTGTRYGIRMEADGLIACGVPGVQLTWMDAKTNDHVVTPRIGKPVEVQALWINALRGAGGRHAVHAEQAQRSFGERFWNADAQCLYDVIDADHVPGRVDASVRPNQIFAVGGLPFAVIDGERAAAVVAKVDADLLTPMGLRSLSPADPAYRGQCTGGPAERDGAYHQGTVWPWLIGAFVEASLRVNGNTPARRKAIRQRCLAPLLAHRETAGLGHISEIADGDAPHTPRGCPFQAWSLGELMRALALTEAPSARRQRAR